MNKIPCEIIRDLLPSYIDKLTSDASNHMIEEHIAECTGCKEVLDSMKETEQAENTEAKESAEKEIDFLKKNRKRNKWILWGCIAAVVVILAVLFITRYLIGQRISDWSGDYFSWIVESDGSHVTLDGTVVDDIFKICSFRFHTEDDGVLYVDADTVPSGFVASLIYGKTFHAEYTSAEPFTQINVNGRILWNNGNAVSTLASSAYQSRHLYIGDMPADNVVANTLNISNYLGRYTNELETAQEPYGWILHLLTDIPADRQAVRETDMESFACVMLAVIGNLDHVTFQYTVDGKEFSKTVTASDASKFFGQDIKNCYDDVSLLDELICKTGLDHYALGSVWADISCVPDISDTSDHIINTFINIVNNSEESISGIGISIYLDGELTSSHGSENADGSPIEKGQMVQFPIESGDLERAVSENAEIELGFTIYTTDGNSYPASEMLRIPNVQGYINLHDLHLSGNAADGFTVSQ